MKVKAVAQLPAGAVPAFLGLILILAVLIEPWIIRRKRSRHGYGRGCAACRRRRRRESAASPSTAPRPRGTMARQCARRPRLRQVSGPARCAGDHHDRGGALACRPLSPPRFLVACTILSPCFSPLPRWRCWPSASPLSSPTAISTFRSDRCLPWRRHRRLRVKMLGFDPWRAIAMGLLGGARAGVVNGLLTVRFGLPAFVATLGMFYIARGLAAWIVSGQQLFGFPENFNLIGRKLIESLPISTSRRRESLARFRARRSAFRPSSWLLLAVVAGIILGYMPGASRSMRPAATRAAAYAGVNTDRVRFPASSSRLCAALAGVIYIAFFRSFIPSPASSANSTPSPRSSSAAGRSLAVSAPSSARLPVPR